MFAAMPFLDLFNLIFIVVTAASRTRYIYIYGAGDFKALSAGNFT